MCPTMRRIYAHATVGATRGIYVPTDHLHSGFFRLSLRKIYAAAGFAADLGIEVPCIRDLSARPCAGFMCLQMEEEEKDEEEDLSLIHI